MFKFVFSKFVQFIPNPGEVSRKHNILPPACDFIQINFTKLVQRAERPFAATYRLFFSKFSKWLDNLTFIYRRNLFFKRLSNRVNNRLLKLSAPREITAHNSVGDL